MSVNKYGVEKFEKMGHKFLRSLLLTMEGLKNHKDREQFCYNFDEEYKKLKAMVAEFDEEAKDENNRD